MAVTKIHPIKATLDMAIGYITNKEKTDEQILVSSFCCNSDTANLSFELTREEWRTKSSVLANHLIQSFAIGETTPEQAHAIGEKLCTEILKGQYEYVLSTHIDRGHIHNHIIFNHVSFVTGKCYRNNKGSYHNIRYKSDKLCRENNLSVIDDQYKRFLQIRKNRSTSRKKWTEKEKGSFKGNLQKTIDRIIVNVNSYDRFLEEMRRQGYEFKEGKHLAFRAADQKKFTRSKTIGTGYSREEIEERIVNPQYQEQIIQQLAAEEAASLRSGRKQTIANVVDISNPKIMNSKGYQVWATKHNLQAISETMIEIQKKGYESFVSLEQAYNNKKQQLTDLQNKIQDINKKRKDLEAVIRDRYTLQQYESHDHWMSEHPEDKLFAGEYKKELYALKKAKERLATHSIMDRQKSLVALVNDYDKMTEKKDEVQAAVYELKDEMKELGKLRRNYLNYTSTRNDQER